MSGYFRSKKSSKGQRSELSEGTSSNLQTTFQGQMIARRASLLETMQRQPEVPLSSRQAAVPRSSRQLWPHTQTEVSAPRMPKIHRVPTPGPTSSNSGSSGVQMSPPHLFLPRMIPALPVVDGSGTPIYPLPPPVAPSAAYRFVPFDTPLISARVWFEVPEHLKDSWADVVHGGRYKEWKNELRTHWTTHGNTRSVTPAEFQYREYEWRGLLTSEFNNPRKQVFK
ncbi:hypothetical protein ACLB2K_007529 [Fragaria x ananassa]